MLLIHFIDPQYWFGYGLFFSALIVTIRTDFELMLISRAMTWGMIPVGWGLSLSKHLPLTLTESILATLFGYALLWLVAYFFYRVRKIEGMGQGDLDLLAMIGSFTGMLGVWTSLFLGALLGTMLGLTKLYLHKKSSPVIAFGPWLACGAIIYVFFQKAIQSFFFI